MIYLVGTGPMSLAYAKVLLAFGREFKVIGRGQDSANRFQDETGIEPITGGLQSFIESTSGFSETDYIIIATGTEALMTTLKQSLTAGAGKVLIEKPAAISIEELLENESFLKPYGDIVFVAYNRRFYASVAKAQQLIEEDGGLETMHFEFTEWSHKIEPLKKAPGVKENWFFANSTHVVDLAFFLGGEPKEFKAIAKRGTISWHSKSYFSGAGITEKGVVFSYHANWESAGNWKIELMTPKRKIILNPLEKLKFVLRGSVVENDVQLANQPNGEEMLKPGLLGQLQAFLQMGGNESALKTLSQHTTASQNYLLEMVR